MTETDCTIVLEILLAEDIATAQRTERMCEFARFVAREAPSAELRTAARLQLARLERGAP